MKKVLLSAILLLSFNTIFTQEFTTKMEKIFTSPNESARLTHVKSALDNNGNIHIVFSGFENIFFYGNNISGNWKFEKLSYIDKDYDETVEVAYYPNIAVDKSNSIHIVAFGRYKETIYYAKKELAESKFSFAKVKVLPEPLRFYVYGEYTDMAIDKNNGLHLICEADYTDQKEFKYNQCALYLNKSEDSEKWILQVLVHDPKFSDRNWYFGNNSSIVCYDEKVYVALGGSNDLHFGTRNISGGTWEIKKLLHTPDEFINSDKDNISLSVSPSGNVKFAFYDRTDDENSPYKGLTVFSKNKCGTNEWMSYTDFEGAKSKNYTATAYDKNGKFYLAIGASGFELFEQSCDCSSEFKSIYRNGTNASNFVDMLIDKQNVVHTFYTSVYDNSLYYLTAIPNGTTDQCNYPPMIVSYTGKTNVAPGEVWEGTITAADTECDKINFYTIIKNDYIKINDHGNGRATINAEIPKGEGFGNVTFTVFVRDEKHENIDNKVSAITFDLKLTKEGNEKGNIKVENKCSGSKSFKPVKFE